MRYRDSQSTIPYNSATAIPTARFASNGFAPSPIYVQSPDFALKYASQNDLTFGNFATAYDNFTLGASHNINGFAWVGGYIMGTPKGVITGFTLTFYADAGNQPGAVLSTYSAAGNFGETLVVGSNQFYTYSWTLAAPFAAVCREGVLGLDCSRPRSSVAVGLGNELQP